MPMVLILLTIVFLLMRVAPGDPISASLGGHAPPAVHQPDQAPARVRQAAPTSSTGTTSRDIARGDFGTTITDHRPLTDIIKRERRGDARAHLLRDDHRRHRRRARRAHSRAVPRHAARRRRPAVRDRRLRHARLLSRPDGASSSSGSGSNWLPTSGSGEPDHPGDAHDAHEHLHVDAIWADTGAPSGDIVKHLILPATTLGLVNGRHLHPPDPRQRDPDAEGRLHRGGARTRHQ